MRLYHCWRFELEHFSREETDYHAFGLTSAWHSDWELGEIRQSIELVHIALLFEGNY
jgi:hypothetical protein